MRATAITLLLGLILVVAAPGAFAHVHAAAESVEYGEQREFGRVGKTAEVTRTIAVDLLDTMRYAPMRLQVQKGETVRLVFRNTGALLHEWVIGTPGEIAGHAGPMQRFPNMEHDEPHNVHVPPGKQRELVWQFNRPGRFDFACLVPGHFEAGMKGIVEVK